MEHEHQKSEDGRQRAYDRYYYDHYCDGRPYDGSEDLRRFLDGVAAHIARSIAPKTALDAGCAMGLLVEALRRHGVEAFGVDVSEYALSKAPEAVRPHLRQASLTEPLGRRYDLIVSMEVLEHLAPQEVDRALDRLCEATDDILFCSTPTDYKELTHINVQPAEAWAELFAQRGFYRDADYDAGFITPYAVRYRRANEPAPRIVRQYERLTSRLLGANHELRVGNVELNSRIKALDTELAHARADAESAAHERDAARADAESAARERDAAKLAYRQARQEIALLRLQEEERLATFEFFVFSRLNAIFRHLMPRESRRFRAMKATLDFMLAARQGGLRALRELRASRANDRAAHPAPRVESSMSPPCPHADTVSIIVCVHNALDDVRRCLHAVWRHTRMPYELIVVDDGSHEETASWLREALVGQQATLIRNDSAGGYTRAANQGLRAAVGSYAVLLNSDTEVTPAWLDGMVECARSGKRIGLVGPLSNTASWQSIPSLFDEHGDWAENPLPQGVDATEWARLLRRYGTRSYPRLDFINGFCLLIKREVLDRVGLFDETRFGEGYGEENDYAFRVRRAGFELAVADDVYVYHHQSRSYSHERRKTLCEKANNTLVSLYGQPAIDRGVARCREDRGLSAARLRAAGMTERQTCIEEGRRRWEGRRVLFLLPIGDAGGGTQVVLQEARAMRAMGVDARFLNLLPNRKTFEQNYPDMGLPVHYVTDPILEPDYESFDAVVATQNSSVFYLSGVRGGVIRGYYIQDYEPAFFAPDSIEWHMARQSYSVLPDMRFLTKTAWNRDKVERHEGVRPTVIGPSVDIDLFRPRPRQWTEANGATPVRVAAMIRPSTPRRAPERTLRVLREIERRHGSAVSVHLFGCLPNDSAFLALPHDFRWHHAGLLRNTQVAGLLNECDVFVDYSSFQAMGLTALEAMACGAATIVPEEGGSNAFARHETNALIVDTANEAACVEALDRLVRDTALRRRLGEQAAADAQAYAPERAASAMLRALFDDPPEDAS